jgi:ligand-binding sensor domain-containing protein/serine phosphatase RsbU (regulator of sigma subunit)
MLVVAAAVQAQEYSMRRYSTGSGLNNGRVTALVQDRQGYVWLATDAGVSRTDGKSFTHYTTKHGLAGDKVTCLAVDHQDRIWVGHRNAGISIINGDSISILNEADGLVNNEVNALICAKNGEVWAGTFSGITIFNSGRPRSLTIADGLQANDIRALAQDADGTVWMGTFGQGISVHRNGKIESFSIGRALPNGHITSLCPTADGMLIGTMGGAFLHKNGGLSTVLSSVGQVQSLACDGASHWIGSFNGLARLRRDATLFVSEQNGLPNNEVLSLIVDREGNLWAGTSNGLACIPQLAVALFTAESGKTLVPNGLVSDRRGRIWASNDRGGLMRKEGVRFVQGRNDPDINDHIIGPIAEDERGNLWSGTQDFGGLYRWDGERTVNYSDEAGLIDNNINALLRTAQGTLLIGTPSGLSVFDGQAFEEIRVSAEPGIAHITTMINLADGGVLLGSIDGTVTTLRDGMTETLHPANVIGAAVNHLAQTAEGIWIATEGNGLLLHSKDRLQQFTELDGLPDMNVRSVIGVGKHLYIGTQSGVHRITLDSTLQVRNITNGTIECRRAAVMYESGSIWFGASGGALRVQLSELRLELGPPELFIQSLQLFYKNVDWKKRRVSTDVNGVPTGFTLGHDDNYLRFQFKAISLSDPEHVLYSWKLEGYEREWTPLSTAESANYPNLPPGKYSFRVRACTGNNICTDESISIPFSIKPPIYQTLWFYILLLIAAIGIVYGYIRWREQRLNEEKQLLELTVSDRTKELRDQKEIVEDQNRHITESIDYARNIQMAMLPAQEEMQRAFKDHFVLYRPKETVGGDFYWMYADEGVIWAAAVDCTGHGVAGAFMSIIGSDLLNQTIIEKRVSDPAQVLLAVDRGIKLAFAQSAQEFESDKGMDVCLVRIDQEHGTVTFAGAQRPLYILQGDKLTEVEGDRCCISSVHEAFPPSFSSHVIQLEKDMRLFLFTDGFADQFGGAKGKKFMTRKLKELLISCYDRPLVEQKSALEHALDSWKGDEYPQLDDVLVMGIAL